MSAAPAPAGPGRPGPSGPADGTLSPLDGESLVHRHTGPWSQPTSPDLVSVQAARHLFWQNVVREMLTGLSMMDPATPETFDGRIAILTHGGERIPIAAVTPMFACAIAGTRDERAASVAVECTVFRVRTPGGEVFTLPLHEVRGLHTLSSDLVRQLEQESLQRMESDEQTPFGWAAYRPAEPIRPPGPAATPPPT